MSACDFKAGQKQRAGARRDPRDAAPCTRNASICAPEAYYGAEFQRLLEQNRRQNQWIFDLATLPHCPGETVYHSASEWLLARDLHRGADSRYLVVFRDPGLYSIRDLRAQHLRVLADVAKFLRRWLPAQEPEHHAKYHLYFHYMPSVFQLHMHVAMRRAPESFRAHHLRHVLRNLKRDGDWYRDALILCQHANPAKLHPYDRNKLA
jgi:hypothetical protein